MLGSRGLPWTSSIVHTRTIRSRDASMEGQCVAGGVVSGDLPPYEAFPIGGVNSVRGYGEGAVGTGRHFVVASGELRLPVPVKEGGVQVLHLLSCLLSQQGSQGRLLQWQYLCISAIYRRPSPRKLGSPGQGAASTGIWHLAHGQQCIICQIVDPAASVISALILWADHASSLELSVASSRLTHFLSCNNHHLHLHICGHTRAQSLSLVVGASCYCK